MQALRSIYGDLTPYPELKCPGASLEENKQTTGKSKLEIICNLITGCDKISTSLLAFLAVSCKAS
jgi:hypothetical protein